MPVTLAAYLGPKPPGLARRIARWQRRLGEALGPGFAPYAVEQVHATLLGLETRRVGGRRVGRWGLETRGEAWPVELERVRAGIAEALVPPVTVRVGGFLRGPAVPFRSRGETPYRRSFAVRPGAAIVVGWPVAGDGFPPVLDRLRRALRPAGFLHKWHRREEDVDNDLYLVLGRVDARAAALPSARAVEGFLRDELARSPPLRLEISMRTASLVAYDDPRLPRDRVRARPLWKGLPDRGELEALFALGETARDQPLESQALWCSACSPQ